MKQIFHFKGQGRNPEFQSAMVRLGIWFFMLVFIGLGAWTEYYPVQMEQYYMLFIVFFIAFASLLVSVLMRPVWPARQYVGLLVDIAGTSYAIILSQNAISPIYLIYIWIFISYGTRYGREHLITATVASLLAYSAVITYLGGWTGFAFEAFFFLIFMTLLPIYQYSLLEKVHLARREAESANLARGRFLASMTHEIRTPLSGIIGMARLMGEENLSNLQKDQLNAIRFSADKLALLVGDILDFSRIDAEKLELNVQPFDYAASLQEICQVLSMQAAEKRLELYCDIAPDIPRLIVGDPLRISQIAANIVSNAIKFTDKGFVKVSLSIHTDSKNMQYVELVVEDSGIGIKTEELDYIFDPFKQADESSSSRFGGVGLGMAIAQNLVELMNGQLRVTSELGKGTTFEFSLPLNSNEYPQTFNLPELNLLVVENDPLTVSQLRAIFATEGINAKVLEGIREISTLSATDRFDAVLIGESAQLRLDVNDIVSLIERALNTTVPMVFMSYMGRDLRQLNNHILPLAKPVTRNNLLPLLDRLFNAHKQAEDDVEDVFSTAAIKTEPKFILVAEDDPVNIQLISTLLDMQGHHYTVVNDGYAALREARSGNYDLAFIDLRMPKMDGLELSRQLRRENGDVSRLPLIALTANASEETRDECLQAGVNEFLIKPIEPEQIRQMIRRYC